MWWHHMHICWFLLEILKIKYHNMDPNWSWKPQWVPHGSISISSCVLVSVPFFHLVTHGPWRCFPGNVATCTTSARDWPWHSGGSVMYPLQFHFDKKPRCKSHQIREWSFGIYIYINVYLLYFCLCYLYHAGKIRLWSPSDQRTQGPRVLDSDISWGFDL